jgi:BASS family bile acid:Na+ symporter
MRGATPAPAAQGRFPISSMPNTGIVPYSLLLTVDVMTLLAIMFHLGLEIAPGGSASVAARPALMLRGLFAVLVAVPAIAWLVARSFDLPRDTEMGIVLMAISPGAPLALRRALHAGGDPSFAPALHVAITVLAVVSMPLSIAVFNEHYGATAAISPAQLARQIFMVQLLPLGLGMLVRRVRPALAVRIEPRVRTLGGVLLVILLVLVLIGIWQEVVGAGIRVALAVAIITLLALAAGHLLGGPEPATRTASAISSAARNPGLALLVVTLNAASAQLTQAVLAYFVVAAITVTPYVAWRKRVAAPAPAS